MQFWIVLGLLVLAEVFLFSRIPFALVRGSVPLNPLGWFGYQEFLEVSVERRDEPTAYWVILGLVTVLALLFGAFIYVVAVSIG